MNASSQTTLFEGRVERTAYHDTQRGERFLLVFVFGVEKPLAVPEKWKRVPNDGDHISATDVTEGDVFWFVGHRSVVTIGPQDFVVWKPTQNITTEQRQQAYSAVLAFARGHPCSKEQQGQKCSECGEIMGPQFGSVSADDVEETLQQIFPDRDKHINGAIFLRLTKRGLLHPFGLTPTKRPHCHASKIPIYHLTKKGMEEAVKLL